MKIDVYKEQVLGLVYVGISWGTNRKSTFGIHLFPKSKYFNSWGYHSEYYNGPIYFFGLGPVALFVYDKYR